MLEHFIMAVQSYSYFYYYIIIVIIEGNDV